MEKGHWICYAEGTLVICLTYCDSESEHEEGTETDLHFLNFIISQYDQQMHNYITNITLLHVSTLSCHAHGC